MQRVAIKTVSVMDVLADFSADTIKYIGTGEVDNVEHLLQRDHVPILTCIGR